jgi:hypothetical protein
MSDEPKPYSAFYIQAWTILSIVLAVLLLGMFIFGDSILHAGQVIWALLRWLASPFI